MPYEVVVPKIDTSVAFKNTEGDILATVDLAELESVILQARIDDPRFNPHNSLSMNAWFLRTATGLSSLLKFPVSITLATVIIREVTEQMAQLKKTFKFVPLSTSLPFTEPIEDFETSDSPESPSTNFSSPTFLASQHSENFESEKPALDLRMKESMI